MIAMPFMHLSMPPGLFNNLPTIYQMSNNVQRRPPRSARASGPQVLLLAPEAGPGRAARGRHGGTLRARITAWLPELLPDDPRRPRWLSTPRPIPAHTAGAEQPSSLPSARLAGA